jgi:hypothetical protein
MEDSDVFERRKIEAFLGMLQQAMGRGAVGVPLPLGFDDARELESWPLIQVCCCGMRAP